MKTFAILLILPALTLARIDVDITASEDPSQRELHISGTIEDLISDQEIQTFNLTDENLKSAVKHHFGVQPDDVFLRSPTPWGDLYVTNSWKQVTRGLKPLKAKVLSVDYSPYLVFTQSFSNNSSKTASFNAEISQDVENTVSSIWERKGEITAEQKINYAFDIKAMAVEGKATFSYSSKWGENVVKSQKVTVGSKTGLVINLEPKQSVSAELYATRGSMKVLVEYMASLSGSVAVNYANLYKDHHFWSVDINKVLEASGLNKTVYSSEMIDLGFYADSKVDVRDIDTYVVLSSFSMPVF